MQKFCNRTIIALDLYNRQPKKFGIIHTPLMQAKKRISILLKIPVLPQAIAIETIYRVSIDDLKTR